jgi:predicted transcriptional regulator
MTRIVDIDTAERKELTNLMKQVRETETRLADKREALAAQTATLRRTGATFGQIAAWIGLTRQRIQQLLKGTN